MSTTPQLSNTDTPAILLNNTTFSWSQDSAQQLINIPHWSIAQGESVFLYGPSGSGKSTLLNLITGIQLSHSGSITILGENISQLTQRRRDLFRAQQLGVIFQQFNLIPYLSVIDNIRLCQHFSGKTQPSNRITELCQQLGLDEQLLSQQSYQLSVGQQQRVAVARALYHQPKIIIADEPTSALDSEARDDFIQLLLQQSQQTNSTVLFVSHDKNLTKHFHTAIDLTTLNQPSQAEHNVT